MTAPEMKRLSVYSTNLFLCHHHPLVVSPNLRPSHDLVAATCNGQVSQPKKLSHMPVLHCLLNTTLAAGIPSQPLK